MVLIKVVAVLDCSVSDSQLPVQSTLSCVLVEWIEKSLRGGVRLPH